MYPPSWSPVPATTPEELSTPIDPLTQLPVGLGGSQAAPVASILPAPTEYGVALPEVPVDQRAQTLASVEDPSVQPSAPLPADLSDPADAEYAALGAQPNVPLIDGAAELGLLPETDYSQTPTDPTAGLPATEADVAPWIGNKEAYRAQQNALASGATAEEAQAVGEATLPLVTEAAKTAQLKNAHAQIDSDTQAQLEALDIQAAALEQASKAQLANELAKNNQKYVEAKAHLEDRINRTQEGAAGYWNDMSAWGQLTTIISLMAGTAAGAMGDGSNPAVPLIMKAIDNDMQAKRSNRANDMQLLQELRVGNDQLNGDAEKLSELQLAEKMGKLLVAQTELKRQQVSAKTAAHKKFYGDAVTGVRAEFDALLEQKKQREAQAAIDAEKQRGLVGKNNLLDAKIKLTEAQTAAKLAEAQKRLNSGNGPGSGGLPAGPTEPPPEDAMDQLLWVWNNDPEALAVRKADPKLSYTDWLGKRKPLYAGRGLDGKPVAIYPVSTTDQFLSQGDAGVRLYKDIPQRIEQLESLLVDADGLAVGLRGWKSATEDAKRRATRVLGSIMFDLGKLKNLGNMTQNETDVTTKWATGFYNPSNLATNVDGFIEEFQDNLGEVFTGIEKQFPPLKRLGIKLPTFVAPDASRARPVENIQNKAAHYTNFVKRGEQAEADKVYQQIAAASRGTVPVPKEPGGSDEKRGRRSVPEFLKESTTLVKSALTGYKQAYESLPRTAHQAAGDKAMEPYTVYADRTLKEWAKQTAATLSRTVGKAAWRVNVADMSTEVPGLTSMIREGRLREAENALINYARGRLK